MRRSHEDPAEFRRLSPAATQAMLDRVIACLAGYDPQQVWLFGSYARGDYHAASDLDLLIIKETGQPYTERAADVWRACDAIVGLSIEPLVYTPAEFARMRAAANPLIDRVLQEGRLIYEQQPE